MDEERREWDSTQEGRRERDRMQKEEDADRTAAIERAKEAQRRADEEARKRQK